MTVYQKITQLLDSHKFEYQTLEHEPAKTCDQSALIRGTTPDQGAKALVCMADKQAVMVVLPCSKKLDFKKFKTLFKVHDLRLASPGEVKEITNLEIGSIPPVGSLFKLKTHVDQSLSAQDKIAFSAGDSRKSVVLTFTDFLMLENPMLGAISSDK